MRHVSPVLSEPLLQDRKLFEEIDVVLNEIRRCYVEMTEFWVDEVQHVTKALVNRRIDPEDIYWWKNFGESLGHVIAHWAVWASSHNRQHSHMSLQTTPTGNAVAPPPSGNTQIPVRHQRSTLIMCVRT